MKKKLTIVEAGEVLVFILVGSRRNPQKNVRRRLSTLFIPETHSQKLLLMFQRERCLEILEINTSRNSSLLFPPKESTKNEERERQHVRIARHLVAYCLHQTRRQSVQ